MRPAAAAAAAPDASSIAPKAAVTAVSAADTFCERVSRTHEIAVYATGEIRVMADAWMVIQNAMTDTRGAPVGARPSSDAGARVAFAAYIGHPLDGGARRK